VPGNRSRELFPRNSNVGRAVAAAAAALQSSLPPSSIQEAYRHVNNFMGRGKRSDRKGMLGNLAILCVKIFYFPS